VKATGLREDRPVALLRRTPAPGPRSSMWTSLADCTGIACAAFVRLALREDRSRRGLLFPEDWVEPRAFYRALTEVGVREADVIDPIVHLPAPDVRAPA
jgi:hypothetical protein